jgi:hypothetical protein
MTATNETKRNIVLNDHITHGSGQRKTVCVSTCLSFFGVPVNAYNYTCKGIIKRGKYGTDNRRGSILRRFGYAVRSRLSSVGGYDSTVGSVRRKVAQLGDPKGTNYIAIVHGHNTAHCIVIDDKGGTVIDTDPRKNDRRRVAEIHAVFPSN